jgi:hypothetical protein
MTICVASCRLVLLETGRHPDRKREHTWLYLRSHHRLWPACSNDFRETGNLDSSGRGPCMRRRAVKLARISAKLTVYQATIMAPWRVYQTFPSSSARCSLFATCKKLTARKLKEHTCVISVVTTPSDAQWMRAGRWVILQNLASESSSRVHPLAPSSTLSRS